MYIHSLYFVIKRDNIDECYPCEDGDFDYHRRKVQSTFKVQSTVSLANKLDKCTFNLTEFRSQTVADCTGKVS